MARIKSAAGLGNRYTRIIERIFFDHYRKGDDSVQFSRDEIVAIAKKLRIDLPKNLGDIIYSFRYRACLPDSIVKEAPQGKQWAIRGTGTGRYCFFLTDLVHIEPRSMLAEIKIPDATPAIVVKYAQTDEQSLLAKLRYNRLIDIFLGITCYSLQSHLRTAVAEFGQIETDELYVGVDKQGIHYIVPVQGKGGNDKIGIVQIEQDFAMCLSKFPLLVCRPVAAQFMEEDVIALFAFETSETGIRITTERHYRLVEKDQLSDEELSSYRHNSTGE